MRFIAPIAALALAGVAWVGCWQEVQLVRLKRQVKEAQEKAAALPLAPRPKVVAAAVSHPPTHAVISQLDQLRELLVEREEAIADARDAAGEYGIPENSPDMDRAILLATQDFDRAIIKLAGPAAARQLTLEIPSAPLPPDVQVAPAPAPSVVVIPAQSAPTTNVYVNVAAPAVDYVAAAPAPAVDPNQLAYATQPVIYGGIGASFGPAVSTAHPRKANSIDQVKFFTASAGIPLSGSPMGSIVATNPILLSRTRSGSAASGR